jgi:competence protein ComEC
MPFPFLFLALALIAGIVAVSVSVLPAAAAAPALIVSLLGAWAFFVIKKNWAAFALLLAATVFFGAAVTATRDKEYETNALRALKLADYADFFGTLVRSPGHEIDRDAIILEVEKVRFAGKEEEVRGRLRLMVPRSAEVPPRPELFTGDKIKVSARIYASKDFNNFNSPFYARYLKSQGIHNRAFTKSPLLIERTAPGKKVSLFHAVSVLRQALQKQLERYFPRPLPAGISPEGAVLEALLLGDDGRMDPGMVLSLQKTGLYHLFAISGAHIAIVTFLFFSLFKLIRVPQRTSYGVLIACLVFYALLVEGSPSVFRAVIMTLCFLTGKLLWKDVHLINTISLSAFILLAANPFSLFDLGFQLTFAATLAIILFYPKLIKLFPKLPLKASELTVMSITASLGVLPILVGDFNRVTFSSLILNYAAVPLVGFVMGAGYIFLPISFAAPFLARAMAFGLRELVRIFSWLSHLLDPVGFISYRVPTPSWIVLAGYFIFLLLLLAPRRFKGQKPIIFAGFAAFFIILITYPFPSTSPDLKVTVLDVGQGDSILVEFPGSRKMLIDGGGFPEGSFDVGERVVSPFLWRKGIKKIDDLVLTHAHPDHLNGLPAVARNFRIGEFWEAESPADSESYRALGKALGSRVPRKRVTRGFVRRESGAVIEALHPPEGEGVNPRVVDNDRSIVLRLTFGGVSFLLPGDIGRKAEAEVLEAVPDIKSRVLKAPHHGSDSSSSAAFLAGVSPEYVVITVGEDNRYGFPAPAVLDRYALTGARVFRTDLDGAIEFSTDGNRLRVRTAAPGDREPRPPGKPKI